MMHIQDGEPSRVPQSMVSAFDRVDTMPPQVRAVVHDYGYPMVAACLAAGVTKPGAIRSLIMNITMGARSTWMNRARGGEGKSSPAAENLTPFLATSGCQLEGRAIIAFLWQQGFAVVPRSPNSVMVEASVAETGKLGLVSKEDKHRFRLRAAVEAAAFRLWPFLNEGSR